MQHCFLRFPFMLAGVMQPLAIVFYERLMPGSQLVNRLQDMNYRVLTLSQVDRLAATVQRESPLLLFVDLATPGEICSAIAKLKAEPATILSGLVIGLTILMAAYLFSAPIFLGLCCVLVVMAAVGLTSLMSGTAATDFGRRKATATCSGGVDGCTYLGSAIQSYFIGHLAPSEKAGEATTFLGVTRNWHWWPIFMVPFAIIGLTVGSKFGITCRKRRGDSMPNRPRSAHSDFLAPARRCSRNPLQNNEASQDLFQGDVKFNGDFRNVNAGMLENWRRPRARQFWAGRFYRCRSLN